jgi:lycopene cyclase domain-containing protein
MNFTYLLIDILTLAGPLALSFDKKVAFASKWRFILPAIGIPALLYLIWDFAFTRLGIWEFNPRFILGVYAINLPLEEILFFLAVPYACLFIYECIRVYFPNWNFRIAAKVFSWILVILCAMVIYKHYEKVYTALTAVLLMITILNHLWVTRGDYLAHLYISWLLAIIPMLVVNGLLTGLPILIYNDQHNLGIRLGSIPIEDFFYNLLLMIWMVWLFERNRQKPYFKQLAVTTDPSKK